MKLSADRFDHTITTISGCPAIAVSIRLKFKNGMPKNFFQLGGVVENAYTAVRHIHGPLLQEQAKKSRAWRSQDPIAKKTHYNDQRLECQAVAGIAIDNGYRVDANFLRRQLIEINQVFVEAPLSIVYSNILSKPQKINALGELGELLNLLCVAGHSRSEIRKQIRRLTSEARFGPVADETFENLDALLRVQR